MSDFAAAQPGQTAAAYIEKKWGGAIRAVPLASVAIPAATPRRVLTNNPRRFEATIYNPSTTSIFVGNTAAEATAQVILLSPLGGSLFSLIDEDGEQVTYEWWVYCASAVTVYAGEVESK